jgi:group I intron endonuclease
MIIYKATNILNNKLYVGKTKYTLEKRKYFHLKNKSKSKFHKAMDKYGIENFIWEIICQCSTLDELNDKEKYYIKFYDSIEKGYNLTKGGDGGDVRSGMKNSFESRSCVSIKLSGHTMSQETKNKISETLKIRYNKGELRYQPFDDDTIEKIKYKYITEQKSINQIGKEMNIINKRICRFFNNNGIEIRDRISYIHKPNL